MQTESISCDDEIEALNLGRRIGEILEEKNISPYAFSQKIGMGKDTLYSCIRGERYIKPSELETMAKVLKLTIERVKREDSKKRENELQHLIDTKAANGKAVNLALDLLQNAIGWTEKFAILNRLGAAYYYQKQYKKSRDTWLEALSYAQRIAARYQESEPLFKVTSNLISAYNASKNYAGLINLLDELEPELFESDPEYAGTLCLSFAIAAYNVGNLEIVRAKLEQSLSYYQKTGRSILIGKGIHNIAYHEYLIGNNFSANEYFKQAIAVLEQDAEARLVSVKDYIKVLIKLNEKKEAISLAVSALEEIRALNLVQLEGKFLMLLAVLKNDTQYAEAVLELEQAGVEQKRLALKFLMDYCSRVDDSVGLMKYYKIAGEYLNKSALFDWEGFIK